MDLMIIAMALAGEEAELLKNLLMDIPMWGKSVLVIPLNSDSRFAINKVHNKTYNCKSKHIRLGLIC